MGYFTFIRKYWLDALIVLFATALVFVTFFQVLNRFLLHLPIAWTEEAARYLSVWVILLGAARAVRENTHIQVDIVLSRLPVTPRQIIIIVTNLLTAGLLVVLVWKGWEILEIVARRRSPALRISMFYIYLAGPVAAALMLYYLLVRTLRVWRDPNAEDEVLEPEQEEARVEPAIREGDL